MIEQSWDNALSIAFGWPADSMLMQVRRLKWVLCVCAIWKERCKRIFEGTDVAAAGVEV
ncbi:hypothetical protein LINPERHAP1_LOCUS34333, partial [Linum perenne]